MAAIKGILVNDGGAPARIINFKAGEAISAGMVLKNSGTAGEVLKATESGARPSGIALTDAASGDQCSMITGSGIVCYVLGKAAVGIGTLCMVDESGTPGYVDVRGVDSDADFCVTLEDISADGLVKVLVL
jgi:hypothetical protein